VHPKAKDLTGLKFGHLTALRYVGVRKQNSFWDFGCVCGAVIQKAASEIVHLQKCGVLSSCGCLQHESAAAKKRTHGMSGHPLYKVWKSMRARCKNPKDQGWKNYGGRGVTVCEEWDRSFEVFYADMSPTYEAGLQIDRIDNNAGYSPGNCRWVTGSENCNNKSTNRRVNGETLTEISKRTGIGFDTLWHRLDKGWPLHLLELKPDYANKRITKRITR
jgi:hypothetical protein